MTPKGSLGASLVCVAVVVLGGCGRAGRRSEAPLPGLVQSKAVPAVAGDASVLSSPHVVFGAPVDTDPSDDYLMDKGSYVLSYNQRRNVANWVGWRVTGSDLGDIARQDDFRADRSLPGGTYQVTPKDYARSGFDRGHLCPSGDRTRSVQDNSTTFLMTNMHPQAPSLNRGAWKSLESHTRRLVQEGREVYVLAGGLLDDRTIGPGVAVPSASYKVIVVLEPGQRPADVTPDTLVISVIMPNDPSVKGRTWSSFAVSVDEVESRSGFDLLSRLEDGVEVALEGRRVD